MYVLFLREYCIRVKYEYIVTLLIFLFLVTTLPDPVYCPNKCGRCYSGPQRKGTLSRHLRHECGGQKKFACSICLKRFTRKSDLKIHYYCVHKLIPY